MSRALRVLLVAVLAGVLSGCDRSEEGSPPAAEPAEAPPAAEPAGEVIEIGTRPEGAVADAQSGVVAVGVREPNGLVLVDAERGEVLERVAVPGTVRHLQLARPGGPVLVPSESADALLTVDLPSGEIAGRVPTGDFPHDATAADDGTVFVTNEFDGSIAVVRDGRVARTLGGQTQPGGIVSGGERVGIVDVKQNDLTVYDTATLRRLGNVEAGDGPTHVSTGPDGRMLVTDTRGDALLVFDVEAEPREVARLDLAGAPYGMAYDAERERLWVTLTGHNEVVAVDVRTASPKVAERFPTVRQPNTVAVDEDTGRLFVTGTKDGTLQVIDP